MRKPDDIARLYLDFDGFFASVEQQADPRLRGRPIGVVPFAGTDRTAVIACSKEAKAAGVKNVMPIREAKQVCPDLILVPQKPDLYRRPQCAALRDRNRHRHRHRQEHRRADLRPRRKRPARPRAAGRPDQGGDRHEHRDVYHEFDRFRGEPPVGEDRVQAGQGGEPATGQLWQWPSDLETVGHARAVAARRAEGHSGRRRKHDRTACAQQGLHHRGVFMRSKPSTCARSGTM